MKLNMEEKRINKYNELEIEFFSSKVNWTYTWNIDDVSHCLDWNFDNKEYD